MQEYIADKQRECEEELANSYESAIIPQAIFINCPIKTTLGVLGKKWTMLIIRDTGVYKFFLIGFWSQLEVLLRESFQSV
ncbi:MAG TPA: hypothetical protein VE643_08865 [Nitrososphaeraceae archaeon]|nr:hypothetical protein [Nitrososphaeraceae archaeon]